VRLLRRPTVLALAALLAVGAHAAPAGAHAEVREADPPAGGTGPVGQDEVTITFITMDPDVPPEIDVLDPDGDSIVTGRATVADTAPTGTTVAVPVEPLEEGLHLVTWRAMSSDGDGLSTGSFEFEAEERSSGSPGVWLLWALALAVPALILLRPGARRTKLEDPEPPI
jgi:methionine-rich copper-binding protein CopC